MEWTGQVLADQPSVTVSTLVDAPPERVWPHVSDIALMADVSSELQHVEWLDGATGPALGARFRGRNENPSLGTWETVSTVVACDEPWHFGWNVNDPDPAARWRLRVTPEGDGCRVEQSAQVGSGPSGLTMAAASMPDKEAKIVFVRLRQWEDAMGETLAAIKERAESGR